MRSRQFADTGRIATYAAVGMLLAAAASAQLTGRTVPEALASEVLDQAVVDAVATRGRVRVLAVLAPNAADPGAPAAAARARLAGTGFESGRHFLRIPVVAGSVDAAGLAALVADPSVLRVSIEQRVTAQLAEAVPLVELDDLQLLGHTGAGAIVAVVDTGADIAHPDLAGAVIAQKCYCDDGAPGPQGCCPNGLDEDDVSAQDDHGHGTRVTSIITSDGVHAAVGGAPDAQIIAVKVLDSNSNGMLSDLLLGLQWVGINHPEVDVVSMSLGFGLYAGDCDAADANTMAMASLVDQFRALDIPMVAGSGNNGSGTGMISPACSENAISVGAVWDANVGSQTWFGCNDATTTADQVTCWSNSSTTTDIFAPGARMTASLLGGTVTTLAGTSYATPMVSACLAVLSQTHPDATVDDLEAAIEASGIGVTDVTNGLEFPRLDCAAAFANLSPATPSLTGGGLLGVAFAIAAVGVAAGTLLRRQRSR